MPGHPGRTAIGPQATAARPKPLLFWRIQPLLDYMGSSSGGAHQQPHHPFIILFLLCFYMGSLDTYRQSYRQRVEAKSRGRTPRGNWGVSLACIQSSPRVPYTHTSDLDSGLCLAPLPLTPLTPFGLTPPDFRTVKAPSTARSFQ